LSIDTERGELTEQRKSIQTELEHLEGLKKWYEEHQEILKEASKEVSKNVEGIKKEEVHV
ncbi:hypothetical protein LCGC14_2372190, partial [marine sediment metagenome]